MVKMMMLGVLDGVFTAVEKETEKQREAKKERRIWLDEMMFG